MKDLTRLVGEKAPQSMALYGGDFELVFVDILFKYELHSHFTYPTYRLPSAYNRWYSVPTKRPEAKQAHAPEIFAISAEDLREDKKIFPVPCTFPVLSWDFRLLEAKIQDILKLADGASMVNGSPDLLVLDLDLRLDH
eukprot:scaffold10429_cov122-Isochrysis_galbana.AAC.5